MRFTLTAVVALIAILLAGVTPGSAHAGSNAAQCVILLHGLGRTAASMEKIEEALSADGYAVANIDYDSRSAPIATLAELAVGEGLSECRSANAEVIHFVTHSLGGILLRHYLAEYTIADLGKSVMLAPPNRGSEAADVFRRIPGFGLLNGDAGYQLGTDENSVPLKLGPADFDVGVIAGRRSIDPISSLVLPNPDDGKVSVESTKLEGMNDFIVLNHSHAFIMEREESIRQIRHYLESGRFDHGAGD